MLKELTTNEKMIVLPYNNFYLHKLAAFCLNLPVGWEVILSDEDKTSKLNGKTLKLYESSYWAARNISTLTWRNCLEQKT